MSVPVLLGDGITFWDSRCMRILKSCGSSLSSPEVPSALMRKQEVGAARARLGRISTLGPGPGQRTALDLYLLDLHYA